MLKPNFTLLGWAFRTCPVLLAMLLTACAAKNARLERGYVSSQLEKRVDHSLNSQSKPGDMAVPKGVDLGDGISEDEAVSLALWNNAAFQETLAKLGFSRADLVQAGLLANPTFSLLFPLGPKQLEFTTTFPLEALWLRPKRMTVARLEGERVAESLIQNGLDLVRDVKVAYIDLMLTQERARLANEAVQLRGHIAELSEARLRAGDVSELEAGTARVDGLRAREEANRSRHDVKLAEERLLNLTGLSANNDKYEFKSATPLPSLDHKPEALERTAFAARPDLRAAELGIEAASKRAGLAKAEILAISGILDANASGKEGFEIGPGVQLPIPIFNRNQGGIARAKAEMERAAWNYLAVKDRIRLEVREAYTRYLQADEDLRAWKENILPPLETSVGQAEKAFELGNVSLLLVYENTRQLLTARMRQAEIAADRRRALAELERSVGQRLDGQSAPDQP